MNVTSVLDAVTVFSRGALCSRVATLDPANGALPNRVRLVGLPLLLESGSLRASVRKGPAGLVIRDVRPELDVSLPAEADVPGEQRELEAAEEVLASLELHTSSVTSQIDAVRRLEPTFPVPAKGAPPRPSSAPAILELSAFVEQSLAPLHLRLAELQVKLKAQHDEVELRRRRIREASNTHRAARTTLSRAAVVTLSDVAGASGPVELVLEYLVMGARWAPAYELDLARTMDTGQLRLRANVVQRTGEDWKDIRLSLSTANLDRRADAPELRSLRIGRRQATLPRSGWREPPEGLNELFADFDAAARLQPTPPPALMEMKTRAGGIGSLEHDDSRSPTGEYALPPPAPPPIAAASMAAPMGAPTSAPMTQRAPGNVPRRYAGEHPRAQAAAAPKPMPAKKARGRAMMLDAVMEEAAELEVAAPADDFEEDGAAFGSGGGGGMPPTEAATGSIEVDRGLLDYGELVLPPPDESGRGALQRRRGPARHDLVLIQDVSVQVNVNVVSIIAVLQRQADAAMQAPLPRWSVVPRDAAAFFDYRYDVENRTSLPSDGGWHSLPVFKADVAMEAEYLTVPSVEPRAFRTVKLTNRTPHALLSGPVDVRLGSEFLMTAPFPTLVPGATQRLGLGVEESIKVSRNTRFDEATGGVFGGATVLTHGVEVEVANRLSHAVTLDVRERVPAIPPGEKDIKVEEGETRPPWSKPPPLPGDTHVEGERSWKLQLEAGETQKLVANVVVKIPASKMLNGGNRRA